MNTNSFGYADVLSHENSVPEDFVIASIKLENVVKTIVNDVIKAMLVIFKRIQYDTAKYKILSTILNYIQSGWPSKINQSNEAQRFFHRKDNIIHINELVIP